MDVGAITSPLVSPAEKRDNPYRAVAKEFEALVATQLTNEMLNAANMEDLTGDPQTAHIWQGFLAEAIGADMATRGTLGIADRIETELRARDGKSAYQPLPPQSKGPE